MLKFKIYGIQNDKYNQLLRRLDDAMELIGVSYVVEKIHDVDEIVSSGVLSVPSLFLNNIPLAQNSIPDKEFLKERISQAIGDGNES